MDIKGGGGFWWAISRQKLFGACPLKLAIPLDIDSNALVVFPHPSAARRHQRSRLVCLSSFFDFFFAGSKWLLGNAYFVSTSLGLTFINYAVVCFI